MTPNTRIGEVPDFAKGRLMKALGHINATERKLSHDTGRGLWSARQAKARLAETWLWLEDGTEFPPLDRYLAREVVPVRLEAFESAPMSDAVKAAWTEVGAAEQAVLETGFPSLKSPMTNPKRDALDAGLARQHRRYLSALRDLVRSVEDVVAERFVDLRPGHWVRVRGGPAGRVLGLEGLTVRLFALDADSEGSEGEDLGNFVFLDVFGDWEDRIRRHTLLYAEVARVQPPEHPPITEPSYYWMLSAHTRLRNISHLVRNADWLVLADVDRMLDKVLDSAAKAWWSSFAPESRNVVWSSHSGQNVEGLESRAPPAVGAPLNHCLRKLRTLAEKRTGALPREPANWRSEMEEMLPLAETALIALEPILESRIDVAVGDWVLSNHGGGDIVARNGTKLIVDIGHHGLREVELFREFLQRIHPSDVTRRYDALPRWHTRWRWFVLNPQARGDRNVCPCCGLPGVEAAGRPCRLCGWIHDGGDFNPYRLNRVHHDLTLDLARARFDALGYAAIIRGSPAEEAAWRDRRILIRRRRLVDALDGLVDGAPGENEQPLTKVEALWADYEASFRAMSARAE